MPVCSKTCLADFLVSPEWAAEWEVVAAEGDEGKTHITHSGIHVFCFVLMLSYGD